MMSRTSGILASALVLLGTFCAGPHALAGQKNDPFDVKINIAKQCFVVAPDLDFGTMQSVLGTETVSSNIEVRCSKKTPFTLSFSPTASTVTTSANLLGQIVGNPDRIAFTVRRTGSSGVGTGLAATNVIKFPVTARLTAASSPRPDTYVRARTIYINY